MACEVHTGEVTDGQVEIDGAYFDGHMHPHNGGQQTACYVNFRKDDFPADAISNEITPLREKLLVPLCGWRQTD